MLFGISRGSDGSGVERYVVYVPFTLAPGTSLGTFDRPAVSEGPGYQLTLEKLQYLYALSIGPFASRDEAIPYLDKLRSSLLWLSLKFNCGVSYPRTLSDVRLFDQPLPRPEAGMVTSLLSAASWTATDGDYDADKATIRPDHKRLMRWEVGRVSVNVAISVNNLMASVREALSFPDLHQVSQKLTLAIEIYAAYRFELSKNAQLITLVTALEALLPDTNIPTHASGALFEAKNAIKAARDAHAKSSAEWHDINLLLARTGNLQREAIGASLRGYASDAALRHPELGDAQANLHNLQAAYDARSTLLHEGQFDETAIEKSLGFLREFVPRLLRVLYKEAAGVAQR